MKNLEALKTIKTKGEETMTAEVKELTTGEASRYLEQKEQEQAQANKESVHTEEEVPVEESDEIDRLDNVAEEQKVQDEHEEDAKDSSSETGKEESKEESKEDLKETLPEITPEDKKVVLCIRDGYRLEMIPVYNADNMIVDKCKLFLVDVMTNIPMIGAGAEMQIAKDRIMSAPDHTVFNVIRKFKINFFEDDIKKVFDRAKEFLENSGSMLALNSSLNIIDAYREVVNRAIEKSKSEDNATGSESKDGRQCKYSSKEKMVSIRDKFMKEILEDTGYTPVTFCKKICMAEVCMGYEILKHNKGRYACNEVGNERFYKLWIIDELMEKSDKEDKETKKEVA